MPSRAWSSGRQGRNQSALRTLFSSRSLQSQRPVVVAIALRGLPSFHSSTPAVPTSQVRVPAHTSDAPAALQPPASARREDRVERVIRVARCVSASGSVAYTDQPCSQGDRAGLMELRPDSNLADGMSVEARQCTRDLAVRNRFKTTRDLCNALAEVRRRTQIAVGRSYIGARIHVRLSHSAQPTAKSVQVLSAGFTAGVAGLQVQAHPHHGVLRSKKSAIDMSVLSLSPL